MQLEVRRLKRPIFQRSEMARLIFKSLKNNLTLLNTAIMTLYFGTINCRLILQTHYPSRVQRHFLRHPRRTFTISSSKILMIVGLSGY